MVGTQLMTPLLILVFPWISYSPTCSGEDSQTHNHHSVQWFQWHRERSPHKSQQPHRRDERERIVFNRTNTLQSHLGSAMYCLFDFGLST